MISDPRQQMMQSWRMNAKAWTKAVRDRQIESRKLVTDAAIVDAILRLSPASILDVGCGEGWLCRALAAYNIDTVGIDASPELIEQTRALGGEFHVSNYDSIPDFGRKFDAIVCNFSLLEEDLNAVMQRFGCLLNPKGALLIQTVHPNTISGEVKENGWQVENFAGFGICFPQTMPWYFRQIASWLTLLEQHRFTVDEMIETVHPVTQDSLSLLIRCRLSFED